MSTPVRIAIVDEHPLFREGVIQILVQRGLSVAAVGKAASDACRIVQEEKPDLLLFDISVSPDGLEAVRSIRRSHQRVKVVALTAVDDQKYVAEALRAGVHGYILKGVSGTELACAIEMIIRNEPYVTPELASRLLIRNRRSDFAADSDAVESLGLTHRERQMLGCLAKGLSNAEIAAELGISIRYLKNLLASSYKKLGVHNRIAALVEAQKLRLR